MTPGTPPVPILSLWEDEERTRCGVYSTTRTVVWPWATPGLAESSRGQSLDLGGCCLAPTRPTCARRSRTARSACRRVLQLPVETALPQEDRACISPIAGPRWRRDVSNGTTPPMHDSRRVQAPSGESAESRSTRDPVPRRVRQRELPQFARFAVKLGDRQSAPLGRAGQSGSLTTRQQPARFGVSPMATAASTTNTPCRCTGRRVPAPRRRHHRLQGNPESRRASSTDNGASGVGAVTVRRLSHGCFDARRAAQTGRSVPGGLTRQA